jgi:hypothetical protein
MTAPKTDRHSIPAQLAAKRLALAAAIAEHQHHAFLHSEGDLGAAEQLEALEDEMRGIERDITRLEAAQIAAGRVATAEDLVAAKRLHAQRMKELTQLNTQIEQVSATLVNQFAALHGPLAELRALLRERGQTAWVITSTLLGSKEAAKRYRVPLDRLAGDERARSLILASIAVSGVTTTGPSLSPHLHLDTLDFGSPESAMARMRDQHAELLALVGDAEAVASQQTNATTEGAEA